ncbi:MAG: tRNA pseudouridine(55) synthase TruB [Candidatus Omnitrophota bacterium]|nr:MAG: tRNA pseudouridine(55) synthase TruB [Candidatus Omnitrophota bacterium]
MDAFLIVDKPAGVTSHDVVDFIRKRFRIKKVGHAGTLDPQATGVLVILLGAFTKRSKEFTECDKEYEACLRLGIATDTLDARGRIVKEEKPANYSLGQIKKVFNQFLGKSEQVPPMFSALKHKGRRLYALARRGIEVKRLPRQIHIYSIKLIRLAIPHIYFTVKCSKGTYVRSLCADIAERLGCAGHMSGLRRTRSGPFSISQAVSLDKLRDLSHQEFRQAFTGKVKEKK